MARERTTETRPAVRGYGRLPKSAVELRNGVMVGATLVVALTFQGAIAPPGGFWQDDLIVASDDVLLKNHSTGNPIWRDKYPSEFKRFRTLNSFAFGLSITAIILTLSSIIEKKGYSYNVGGIHSFGAISVSLSSGSCSSRTTGGQSQLSSLSEAAPGSASNVRRGKENIVVIDEEHLKLPN